MDVRLVFGRFIVFGLLNVLFIAGLSSSTFGDSPLEAFANCLPKDVAATIHLPEFSQTFEQLERHPVFQDDDFVESIGTVVANYPNFAEKWEAFSTLAKSVEQVHFAIWKESANSPIEFVGCFQFKAEPESIDDLNFLAGFLNRSTGKEEESRDEADESNVLDESNNYGLPKGFEVKLSNDWLFVGNSSPKVDELWKSVAGGSKPDRPLVNDRRFKMAMIEFERWPVSSIFGFARPQKFPELFSESGGDEKLAAIENLSELSAAFTTIQIQDESGHIAAKTCIANTLPATGMANNWTALSPLPKDFPGFCFEPKSVEASAWDEEKSRRASEENYDRVHGKGKYKAAVEAKYGRYDLTIDELFSRSSSRFFVRYESKLGLSRSVLLQRVEDYEAMKKYLAFVAAASDTKKLDLAPKTDNDAIVYGVSQAEIEQKWKKRLARAKRNPAARKMAEKEFRVALEKSGKTLQELGSEAMENDGWVLTEDWLLHGNLMDVFAIIDFNNDINEENDQLRDLSKRIDWLNKKARCGRAAHLRSGEYFARYIPYFFAQPAKVKYGKKNSLVKEIFKGRTFEDLSAGNEVNGDAYDMATYLALKTIYEHCNEMVVIRPQHKEGGTISTSVFGMFFELEQLSHE